MSGINTDKEKLNLTLEKVCSILHKNDINDWFIVFGTLLGIVRENSCIEGDDDLDIMINCDYQTLRSTFEREGFIFTSKYGIKNPDTILKTEPCDKYASFDFYMSSVEGKNYFSQWQNIEFQNIEVETKVWRSTHINLPQDAEIILEKLYGATWRTPIKYTSADQARKTKEDTIYNTSFKSII